MRKRFLAWLLSVVMVLTLLPVSALAEEAVPGLAANVEEQFQGLTVGGAYWFDLSGTEIKKVGEGGSATVNPALPDGSLRYVPFTYAGTVNAYVLNNAASGHTEASTDAAGTTSSSGTYGYRYDHSLFVADYNVTHHNVSCDNLKDNGLIFGDPAGNYTSGGVSYSLRAPSVGSDVTSSGENTHGTPETNEWDAILDKGGDILNGGSISSYGQDSWDLLDSPRCAGRGWESIRSYVSTATEARDDQAGFRPVLEVLNPGSLTSDGLKTVTLDLNGGKLATGESYTGGEINSLNLVYAGGTFAAPSGDGFTRPAGNAGVFFAWTGSDGNRYESGSSVPSTVTTLTAVWTVPEQFSLTPGETYWFDLSGTEIKEAGENGSATVNPALPDVTLNWVPFTYSGTVNAYSLTEDSAGKTDASTVAASTTDRKGTYGYRYDHSLFVADYNLTYGSVNWEDLNSKYFMFRDLSHDWWYRNLSYSIRPPTVGSSFAGSGESTRGTTGNEWDAILDKGGYIRNCGPIASWGQDTAQADGTLRAYRGCDSTRGGGTASATYRGESVGFRPVLEILDAENVIKFGGLKVATLGLNGGKLTTGPGYEGPEITQMDIIYNTNEIYESYTVPGRQALTRPDGNDGNYFAWEDESGKRYRPGDRVFGTVAKLTAVWSPVPAAEQFSLAPGETYWFDLSGTQIKETGENGSATVNPALPDGTLHWVPFTYAGTVNAYVLNSASDGQDSASDSAADTLNTPGDYGWRYDHSLFVADYNVTYQNVSWDGLNGNGLIFGTDYSSGGAAYTLRAPSGGNNYPGWMEPEVHGTPLSNEWDTMLDKDSGFIKNCDTISSFGQDTAVLDRRVLRGGNTQSGYWSTARPDFPAQTLGFRPVLEVLDPEALTSDGLKTVTLDLNGGKVGENASISVIVKNGAAYPAPSGDGLTRPQGNTGTYFKWQDDDGNRYAPGASVPAAVTTLTAVWVEKLTGIEITTQPKLAYTDGDTLDLSALALTASYDSGRTAALAYNSEGVSFAVTGGEAISHGADLTYGAHNGKTITVSYGGKTAATNALTVSKQTQAAPSAPTAASVTADSVTLNAVTGGANGAEYSNGGETWQDSPTFENLTAATKYTFYARFQGGDHHAPSPASPGAEIYTAAAQPGAGVGFTVNYGTETASAASGYEISTDNSNWSAGPVPVTPGGKLYARVKAVTGGAPASESTENALSARPAAPTGTLAVHKSADSITVTNADAYPGCEFSADGTAWNTTGVLSSLKAETSYQVQVRVKATESGFASNSLTQSVTTPAADGSTVLKPGESAESTRGGTVANHGDTVTLEKDGAETIVTPPANGDTNLGADGTVSGPGGSTVQVSDTIITLGPDTYGKVDPHGGVTLPGGGSVTVTDSGSGTETTVTLPTDGGRIEVAEDGAVILPGGSTVQMGDGEPATIPEGGGRLDPAAGSVTENIHTITFDSKGGSAVASVTVAHGGTVNRPADPTRSGYSFAGWYRDEGYTAAWDFAENTVTGDLTLYAKWKQHSSGGSTPGHPIEPEPGLKFTDVSEDAWYYEAVRYVADNGLFNGTTDTKFSPNSPMTRAMLVTVLYRAAGEPTLEEENLGYPFADIDASSWYGMAVYWARLNRITSGTGGDTFSPGSSITREQLAAMLYRYAGSPESSGTLEGFLDGDSASGYAVDALRWAVERGILAGKGGGVLDPTGNATRAEVAAVLERFLKE